MDVNETQLRIKDADEQDAGVSLFQEPVREIFAREIVEVFSKEKAVAEIARKHPGAADRVAPLKEWLREQLKER